MNMERTELPIFIRLIEKKGDPTDKLVNIIWNMIEQHDVVDIVKLENIIPNPVNAQENHVYYSVTYEISNKREGELALTFLMHVFQRLFNNYPAYVEPL